MIIQIRQDILDKVKKDDDILIAIAKAAVPTVKYSTALTWVRANHMMLTAETIQSIIKKGLAIPEDEKITEMRELELSETRA